MCHSYGGREELKVKSRMIVELGWGAKTNGTSWTPLLDLRIRWRSGKTRIINSISPHLFESMAGVQRHMRPAFTTAAALLFRAALAYFFSDVLERAPQISTPFHSSAAAREARALIKLGLSPYAGEAYHGGPLLLLALPDDVAALPFVLADAVTIFAATAIANAFDAKQVHTFALVHAWNPWAILACAARSTATLDTALCVGALACAAHEQGLLSGVLLALCLNVLPGSVLPILLMLPCLALLSQRRRISLAVGALATTIPVAAVNCLLCTHWGDTPFAWLDETFGAQARTESLVPNMGLSWYLQIQTFPEYRRTMQCVMYMHVGALAVPAWLRLRSSVRDGDVIRHRRVAMHVAALVATSHLVFRPYPSAADVATTVLISACVPSSVSRALLFVGRNRRGERKLSVVELSVCKWHLDCARAGAAGCRAALRGAGGGAKGTSLYRIVCNSVLSTST